jgi:hypothetical protein
VNKAAIMLEDAREVYKKIIVQNAIELIGGKIETLHGNIEEDLKSEINSTSFKFIYGERARHPLAIPRTLLDGTQWEDDEPTLTRLLAYAINNFAYSPELTYNLFCEIFSDREIMPFRKQKFIDLAHGKKISISAESEIYSDKKEKEKHRRADILINIKSEENKFLPIKILIEAKVKSKFDCKQLKQIKNQFTDNESKWLYYFLHIGDETENEKNINNTQQNLRGLCNLPDPWKEYLWEDVILAFEKLLRRISYISEDEIQENDFDVWWMKLLMGTLWKGALKVTPTNKINLFVFFSNTHFTSILNKLKEEDRV